MTRLRVGFLLTTLMGALWATVGLFSRTDGDVQLLAGVCVAMLGIIGTGAVDWLER